MKQRIILSAFFCFFLYSTFSIAQGPLVKQWDRRFGGPGMDLTQDFKATSDGGFILMGYISTDSSGDISEPTRGMTDYWLVKTDASGIKQWDKRFGGSVDDPGYKVNETSDHGYIVGGWSTSDVSGDKTMPLKGYLDYWIVKIDSLGNKQWDKDFGGANGNVLFDVKQTDDGGYILGGYSDSDSSGDKTQNNWDTINFSYDWWIIKTDFQGNKLWDKRYGTPGSDFFKKIVQTPDGGYLIGGYTDSIGGDKTQLSQGSVDYWIVKIDTLGNKQWDKRYGGTGTDELADIELTTDGGYLLGGSSGSDVGGDKTQPSKGMFDYWVVKIDSLGNKQWDKTFGSTSAEEFMRIISDQQGNYFLSGDSYSPAGGDKTENNLGTEQGWVVKIDALGNKIWDKTILTSGHDETVMIVPAGYGCYAVANFTNGGIGGYQSNPTRGAEDYWMVKFCDSTLTTSLSPGVIAQNDFSVFPNPFNEELVVIADGQINENVELTMYDIYGRLVLSQQLVEGNNKINTGELSNGIYIICISTDVKIVTAKIIKAN